MEVDEIVMEARSLGIGLRVEGDQIIYSPKSAAPTEFVSRLKKNKPELLKYLRFQQLKKDSQSRDLLSWAMRLGNRELTLEEPVTFNETGLRKVTTGRVSEHARQYLRTIARAEMARRGLNWEPWTAEWHEEQAEEAMQSLKNLRAAMEERE